MKQLVLLFVCCLWSCAIGYKPCSDSGDASWPNKLSGDKKCYQKKDANGKFTNEGEFKQIDINGKVLLHGFFKNGKKDGLWTQYNEKGEKLLERYFEMGVEKSIIAPQSPVKK